MHKLKTFKHSGDLGDIIFSLPCIKEKGGGILYLDPEGGEQEPVVSWSQYNRTKLNQNSIDFIKPLLEVQKYIKEVRLWSPEIKVDYNLDQFRRCVRHNNLMTSHLEALNLLKHNEKWQTASWLDVDALALPEDKKYVLSRSCRYQGNHTFWETLQDDIIDNSVFISHEKEFDMFLYTFPRYEGRIARLDTQDVLSLAGYIKACELFIGNAGFPHAIAEGLKKPLIQEVYTHYPPCMFKRGDAKYV